MAAHPTAQNPASARDTFHPGRVYLEGWEMTFEAFIRDRRWNGWRMPVFTKPQMEAFGRAFTRPGIAKASYFPPTDTWTFWSSDGYVEQVRGQHMALGEGRSEVVYDVGSLGWTWLEDAGGDRVENPVKEACCTSCAQGKPCTGGCGGHDHGHAKENPLPTYGRDHQGKVTGPVFAVGEGEEGAGECSVFGCGDCGCAQATPAAPTALRFEMARVRPGGGYNLAPAPLHALPPELQALYARGACQGEACLPLFRVQPVDPAYFREALEKARALGPLTNSKKLYSFLKGYFAPPTKKHPQGHLVHEQEEFVCLSLDVHGYVRGLAPIARGARDSVQTPIADILRVPIVAGASSFVVAHNHPSGSCKPSKSDEEVTKALVKATAAIEGLLFLDHLVIGEGRYYSFRDHKKV